MGEEEEWKQVPAKQCRQHPSRPTSVPQVPLCNRFEALEPEREVSEDAGGDLPAMLPKVRQLTPHLKSASTRKDRTVIVIGSSLLRGMEGPVCWPDPTRREVCCLSGVRVRDISRKLPSLIHPSYYYPLLIVQANSDEVADRSLKIIKNYFRGLGRLVEETDTQVVFSSVPSLTGKDTERAGKPIL